MHQPEAERSEQCPRGQEARHRGQFDPRKDHGDRDGEGDDDRQLVEEGHVRHVPLARIDSSTLTAPGRSPRRSAGSAGGPRAATVVSPAVLVLLSTWHTYPCPRE